jgi:fructose-1,6-bisphosphatase I
MTARALSRHVLSEQIRLGASASGDLTLLINAIEFTSKFIASNVRKARLINLFDLLPALTHTSSY